MAVLIKGMEMPESCWKCPFMYARVYCVVKSKLIFDDDEYSELNKRYDGCPLAEVPESHGRLIDADKLKSYWEPDHSRYFDADCFIHTIDFAQTIIPASGGEEDE